MSSKTKGKYMFFSWETDIMDKRGVDIKRGAILMKQCACITGADRGLGLELAGQLLEHGYTVLAGRYNKEWTQLEELKEAYPDRLFAVELDVSEDASVKAAAEFISSRTDALEMLINNSAILGDIETDIFGRHDFDEMQRVFNVNTLGALRVTNGLLPLVTAGEKKLVLNITSEAGSIGACWRTSWFAYCMSKAALNMHSVITHNSLKELGGQVVLIHPGWMKSWLSGQYQEEAPLTPLVSARHIMEIIRNSERYKGDKPAFLDYQGNGMEW